MQFFFNSYVYNDVADILSAMHVVIYSMIEIIAYCLVFKYLFHLTVQLRTCVHVLRQSS